MQAGQRMRRAMAVAVGALCVTASVTAAAPAGGSAAVLRQIGALERARAAHPAAVVAALRHPEAAVRRRAVIALGRLRDSLAIPALAPLVRDANPEVRADLAFTLGQIGAAAGVAPLQKLAHDPSSDVRLETAEALGKLGHQAPLEPLLALLRDRVPAVRGQAALGLARRVDSLAVAPLIALSRDDEPGVRWKATYALEKIVWPDSVLPAVRARTVDEDPLVRAYAARTLGRQRDARAGTDLEALLFDRDPRVVINAVRSMAQVHDSTLVTLCGPRPFLDVAPSADPESLAQVFLFRTPDEWRTQTLVATAQSLGALGDRDAVPLLVRGLRNASAQVRYSCAGALVQLLKDGALPHLGPLFWDPSPQVRNKVVDMCGDLAGEESWQFLVHAWNEPNGPRMRQFAASAFERRRDPRARAFLHRPFDDADVQLTAQLASTVAACGLIEYAGEMQASYARFAAPAGADARLSIVAALAALADSAAQQATDAARSAARRDVRAAWHAIAASAWTDPDPRVRQQADSAAVHIDGAAAAAAARAAAGAPRPEVFPRGARRRPAAEPFATAGEMAALLHTTRGDIGLELYPADAPQTVANWVTLARSGYFTGIEFHRVVPNFVIQAGDPDSTGSGGPGYSIPDEFNRHRYGPGALGMALSGPDTGGSQWFITHSPQPHLDGRYTIFGQVVQGMEIVDQIEEGDAITGIDIHGGPAAAPAVRRPKRR